MKPFFPATSRALGVLLLTSLWAVPGLAVSQTSPAAPASALEATAPSPAHAPTATPNQGLWQLLEMNPYIPEGASTAHAKAVIYAFFDPNCIFCHLGWKLSQPYLKTGLQVRWIPIAFVASDSAAKAAWLLTSKDPSAALNHGEGGWKEGVGDGGGAFLDAEVTPAVKAQIKANENLFRKLGLSATPSFVYLDREGKLRTISGITNQHMYSDMTGLAFIPTTDPALAEIPK